MSIEYNLEIKNAYKLAVQKYGISPKLLTRLHKVSGNSIDKWLYAKDRYPTFQALYELYLFIKRLGGEDVKEVTRIIVRARNRAYDLVESLDENPISDKPIRKLETAERRREYLYDGCKYNINQLAEKFNVSAILVSRRIKDAGLEKSGSDISNVNFSRKKSSKKQQVYMYKNQSLNITELSEKFGISIATVRKRIKEAGLQYINSDISSVDFSVNVAVDRKLYNRAYRLIKNVESLEIEVDFSVNELAYKIENIETRFYPNLFDGIKTLSLEQAEILLKK